MRAAEQIPLDFITRHAMGREDFLVSTENKDALGWIDKWPDWNAPCLILSGPAASGKTHLAAVWRDRSGAVSVAPERLLHEPAELIAEQSQHLVIDGIDPWMGDPEAETTLFHLYNLFREEGRSLLLTLRMTPSRIEFAVPDLASRLRAAPLAIIHSPDDELLASLLVKQFYDRQLSVTKDVVSYVLPRMERTFDAIGDIVDKADKMALAQKRPVTIALMREVLAELQR